MIEEDYMAVTQVVMVGGATRMPCVQRIVRNCTGIEPEFPVNPDEAVALGAAVRAGMNSGVVEGLHAVDPWPACFPYSRSTSESGARTPCWAPLAGALIT